MAWQLSFGCHLPGPFILYHFTLSLVFVFKAELCLLEGACSWVLFFNLSSTPCLLIGEFSWWIQLPLGWSLIDEYLVLPFCLLFSGCSMSPFISFPLCFCLPFGLGSFSMMFLFFYVLHLCSIFMFYCYYGVCIKCLGDKIAHFSTDSTLSLFNLYGFHPFFFPFCVLMS